MARKLRIIAEGYPHHVVNRGHNSQVIFRNDYDLFIYAGILSHYLNKLGCELMAYCLMPNHIHLMLRPLKREDLIEFMHAVSFRYAKYFNSRYERKGALWEYRYFSSIIVDDDYAWRVAKYICLNPVRANIVDKPWEYRWSSANDLIHGIKGEIPIIDWIDERNRDDFSRLLVDAAENDNITQQVLHNQPYASIFRLKEFEHEASASA